MCLDKQPRSAIVVTEDNDDANAGLVIFVGDAEICPPPDTAPGQYDVYAVRRSCHGGRNRLLRGAVGWVAWPTKNEGQDTGPLPTVLRPCSPKHRTPCMMFHPFLLVCFRRFTA